MLYCKFEPAGDHFECPRCGCKSYTMTLNIACPNGTDVRPLQGQLRRERAEGLIKLNGGPGPLGRAKQAELDAQTAKSYPSEGIGTFIKKEFDKWVKRLRMRPPKCPACENAMKFLNTLTPDQASEEKTYEYHVDDIWQRAKGLGYPIPRMVIAQIYRKAVRQERKRLDELTPPS